MKKWLTVLILLAGLTGVQAQATTPLVVGYYASWKVYEGRYRVDQIQAQYLTHINYAFANVSEDGECIIGDELADTQIAYPQDESDPQVDADGLPLAGNMGALLRLKRDYPHLKTLLSVGGWTWSEHFSDAVLTPAARQVFATSCVALMQRYGFDGLDMDWEYPVTQGPGLMQGRPEDTANYTLMMAEVRQQMDALSAQTGQTYLLTIAASASPYSWDKIDVGAMHPSLDFINLMAYDMQRTGITDHHAALYMTEGFGGAAAVEAYLEKGVPADKLTLGVGFYGHGWKGVPDVANGLGQPYTEVLATVPYSELVQNYLTPATTFYDETAQAAWYYSPLTEIMMTFDNARSLTAKTAYVREQHLGGIMIWELSQDVQKGDTLLATVWQGLQADR